MIKEEKIRMMTQVAMIQKREERRAIEICGYRKKDYVSIQMIKIWICYTMAYLLPLRVRYVHCFQLPL